MSSLVIFVVLLAMLLVIRVAARRFDAAARKAGRWDSRGPLVETEAPPYRYLNRGMEERREVVGNWTPPIIHDRRDEASRHPEGDVDHKEERD